MQARVVLLKDIIDPYELSVDKQRRHQAGMQRADAISNATMGVGKEGAAESNAAKASRRTGRLEARSAISNAKSTARCAVLVRLSVAGRYRGKHPFRRLQQSADALPTRRARQQLRSECECRRLMAAPSVTERCSTYSSRNHSEVARVPASRSLDRGRRHSHQPSLRGSDHSK